MPVAGFFRCIFGMAFDLCDAFVPRRSKVDMKHDHPPVRGR